MNAEHLQVMMMMTTMMVVVVVVMMMSMMMVAAIMMMMTTAMPALPHAAQDFRDWSILPIKVQPTYKLLGYTPQKPVPLPSHLPLEKNRLLRVGGEDECVRFSSHSSHGSRMLQVSRKRAQGNCCCRRRCDPPHPPSSLPAAACHTHPGCNSVR